MVPYLTTLHGDDKKRIASSIFIVFHCPHRISLMWTNLVGTFGSTGSSWITGRSCRRCPDVSLEYSDIPSQESAYSPECRLFDSRIPASFRARRPPELVADIFINDSDLSATFPVDETRVLCLQAGFPHDPIISRLKPNLFGLKNLSISVAAHIKLDSRPGALLLLMCWTSRL